MAPSGAGVKRRNVQFATSMMGFSGKALDTGDRNKKREALSSLASLDPIAGGTFLATVPRPKSTCGARPEAVV